MFSHLRSVIVNRAAVASRISAAHTHSHSQIDLWLFINRLMVWKQIYFTLSPRTDPLDRVIVCLGCCRVSVLICIYLISLTYREKDLSDAEYATLSVPMMILEVVRARFICLFSFCCVMCFRSTNPVHHGSVRLLAFLWNRFWWKDGSIRSSGSVMELKISVRL